MKPVVFECRARLPQTPQEIADGILQVENWSQFRGFGPLPGIRSAEFETRTSEVVGSRIRVVNTDGSKHVEVIQHWAPDSRIVMVLEEFTPPLSRLAAAFEESWSFSRVEGATDVVRRFEMQPQKAWTRPILWLIGRLLKRAVQRHLHDLRGQKIA